MKNFLRTILRLALPNVAVMMVQASIGLIETYFVAKLGLDALAGIALVFPLFMLLQMVSAGAVGGGILSAIASLVVIVPTAIIAVIVTIVIKGSGMGWNEYTVTAAILAVTIVVVLLLCVIALVSVPVAVFFPAYAMYFFAERYPALYARLYPPPSSALPIVAPEPIT